MQLAHLIANEVLDAKAARRLARLLSPVPAFAVHLPENNNRAEIEQYIAERFHAIHGAHVHDFMPTLLTMGCGGHISAASGVRAAAQQTLFLEQYLTEPVEQAVSRSAGERVERFKLAEIGNLVASQGGSSYLLFLVLTATLNLAGFEWVVFTATPQVRKVLKALGLQTDVLCKADPARLAPGSADDWGQYYASHPQVVTGKVNDAMAVLENRVLYAGILSIFRPQIEEMAAIIARESNRIGTFTLAA
ncbi:MAG TPA: thermostable hemolysin [Xanthomonadales bacterium]|nr:thermostable hemolysin [Xanthomonadales bacterium]